MSKPRLLDLFCCAGGASMGYHLAGFDVTGVDIKPQKNYPFNFIQSDVFNMDLSGYDAFHASPPCQFASELTPVIHRADHPNLIPQTRALLLSIGKPFIIENVELARTHLINPLKLCGSMFGLDIFRHRYFENNIGLFMSPKSCRHNFRPVVISGQSSRIVKGDRVKKRSKYEKACAMGIDWMNVIELSQAIPPIYTHYLGEHLVAVL